jgi:hypothetical protein
MIRRLGGFWLVGLGGAVVFAACAPTTSEVGTLSDGGEGGADGSMNGPAGGSSNQPTAGTMNQPTAGTMNQPTAGRSGMPEAGTANQPDPGACIPGDRLIRGDGCNTCLCTDDRVWSCTDIACNCTEGEQRAAGDACSTCTCNDNQWVCTDTCAICNPGELEEEECSRCVCSNAGQWNCTNLCPECLDGDKITAEDGCNTCDCVNGTWACTDIACTEECEEGDTAGSPDLCNSCYCNADGRWECTTRDCPGSVCDEGYANCDGQPDNGCEVNLERSVTNCGSCGYYCALPGAVAACEEGACVIDYCTHDYEDCNGDTADGCEVPVGPGGCENRCEVPEGSPEPTPTDASCNCPEGTACVRGSVENEAGEYCFPLTESCTDGFASCACLGACVCPESEPGDACAEQMGPGGQFIVACSRAALSDGG